MRFWHETCENQKMSSGIIVSACCFTKRLQDWHMETSEGRLVTPMNILFKPQISRKCGEISGNGVHTKECFSSGSKGSPESISLLAAVILVLNPQMSFNKNENVHLQSDPVMPFQTHGHSL